MPISFELAEGSKLAQAHYHAIALEKMRPVSRKYDLAEHTLPTEWVDYWWNEGRFGPDRSFDGSPRLQHPGEHPNRPASPRI
jgi:hypothetical protein